MDQECIDVPLDVYHHLLLRSMDEENLSIGRKLHVLVASRGLELNEYLGTELVHMFIHFGSLLEAHQAFFKLPDPTISLWKTRFGIKCKVAQDELAIEKPNELQRLDDQQIVSELKACSSMAKGLNMHSFIIETGIEHNDYIRCTLVDMYARCGSLERAYAVFERLTKENIVMWNTLIIGYCDYGFSKQALELFYEMQCEGIKPQRVTFIGALKACTNILAYDNGRFMLTSLNRV